MNSVANQPTSATPMTPAAARLWIVVCLLFAGVTLLVHGSSLNDGLYLDDHWHQQELASRGWSWGDLIETTTIEPGRFMECWWQERDVKWTYGRPVSVLLMKVVLALSGGSAVAQHAVSLALHFVNAILVYVLCVRLTDRRLWAMVGGLLFLIYSHSVIAVSWLAAQNALLQTMLTLAALLCYLRASGLRVGFQWTDGARRRRNPAPTLEYPHGAPGYRRPGIGPVDSVAPPSRIAWPWLMGAMVAYLLALFSRENAMMFPAIVLAFEFSFGGWRWIRRRWAAHAIFALMTVAFLVWRMVAVYHPVPDVYLRRPDEWGAYALWCVSKLLHYLCAGVWHSPMTIGPTGRGNPFVEVPGDCGWTIGILVVMGAGYVLATRNARGWWIWPLWLVLSFVPVIPVMATPHSGYLASVGYAVCLALAAGLHDRARPRSIGRWSRGVAIFFLIATTSYLPIYRSLYDGLRAGETCTLEEITADSPPSSGELSDLYFINLPFVDIYAETCLKERWGAAMEGVRCHALTFAPNLMAMDQAAIVDQIDEYSFTVSVRGQPYFSRLLGRFLIEAYRHGGPFRVGESIRGDGFGVRIDAIDVEGVRGMTFRFDRPLADGTRRFYVVGASSGAVRLRFDPAPASKLPTEGLAEPSPSPQDVASAGARLAAGDASAAEVLFSGMVAERGDVRDSAFAAFRRVAGPIGAALGCTRFDGLESERPSRDAVFATRQWWRVSVDDALVRRILIRDRGFAELRTERGAVGRITAVAARIIKTDLYLTGPPFPGPRYRP